MKTILSSIFLLISLSASSQMLDPVKWTFSQKQISESSIELQFKASIEENWHLYSQDIPESPPATTFTFIINEDTSIVRIDEPNAIESFDSNFDMLLKYFADEVIFRHTINLIEGENTMNIRNVRVPRRDNCEKYSRTFWKLFIN